MIDPIAAWHTEHVYFGQLLARLRKELDAFHQGDRPNYELMRDIITYLRDYTDQYHHRREDEAFDRLGRRCPDLELVLARLQQEHRVIAHAGQALLEQIEAILLGALVPRATVESLLATYLVYYGNHLALEEEDVLPRAAKELDAEDWRAVRDAAAAGRDPLFGTTPEARYRELRRQIALEG